MTIMVVGARGLIGSALVAELSMRCEDKIIAIDIVGETNYEQGWKTRAAEIREATVWSQSSYQELVDLGREPLLARSLFEKFRPDIVVNCGGNSLASEFADLSRLPSENMSRLNEVLLALSVQNEARYVYVSSSMVYGNFSKFPVDECSELRPVDPYGALKLGAEHLVRACGEQYPGFDYCIVRPSAVYGALDSNERVIVKMLHSADSNESLYLRSADQVIDFTPVELVAQLLGRVVLEGGLIRNTYNLANGMGFSLRDVKRQFGDLQSLFLETKEPDELDVKRPKRGALAMHHFRERFGDFESVSIESGFGNLVDASSKYGLIGEDFRERILSRGR